MASVESKSGTPPLKADKHLEDSGGLSGVGTPPNGDANTLKENTDELDAAEVEEDTAVEEEKEEPASRNLSPFHSRLLKAKQSPSAGSSALRGQKSELLV